MGKVRSRVNTFGASGAACVGILLACWGCGEPSQKLFRAHPRALVDSVLAHYGVGERCYRAFGQVIVPAGKGHGYFDLELVVAGWDSALLRVARGEPQWVRIDSASIQVKRLPGKPLVLLRGNVNHDPVEQRELYVLLPDIFSWLLDAYSLASVRRAGSEGYCVTLLPRRPASPIGRVEVDVALPGYQVREARVYSRSGDLGGRIGYHDFTRSYGYWIPRSVAVDFVVGADTYDELYRLLRLQRLNRPGPPARGGRPPAATPGSDSSHPRYP
ncbi:MAG: hypothetical protein ONB23_05385 [candidate division KSB1 bacterium]|nr:hypothetical protein [candidate division KSB1 bacterium]